MGLVVDTSALVALERFAGEFDSYLVDLESEPAVLPAIVYAELRAGVRLADSAARAAKRRARIEALVSRLPVVEFDQAVAERWADVFAELTRRGRLIPSNDIAVAATALHLGFAVLLGPEGESHYERVPELVIRRLEHGRS